MKNTFDGGEILVVGNGEDRESYIFAQVDMGLMNLVSLRDGNRFFSKHLPINWGNNTITEDVLRNKLRQDGFTLITVYENIDQWISSSDCQF